MERGGDLSPPLRTTSWRIAYRSAALRLAVSFWMQGFMTLSNIRSSSTPPPKPPTETLTLLSSAVASSAHTISPVLVSISRAFMAAEKLADFDGGLRVDVAGEREVLLLHQGCELLALDDAELAALDELGDEHVLRRLGAAAIPPLVVRLVLELQHRHAGFVAGCRPGEARSREDREQQGGTEGKGRNTLHGQTSFRKKPSFSPILLRRTRQCHPSPHKSSSWASTTQRAVIFTISLTSRPLWSTWTGFAMPRRTGPIASAPARRQISL